MIKRLLRRLAWKVIEKTGEEDGVSIVFTHRKCRSTQVVPLPRMFLWKTPTFECLGCMVLTDDVDCKLVEKQSLEAPTSYPPPLAYPLY